MNPSVSRLVAASAALLSLACSTQAWALDGRVVDAKTGAAVPDATVTFAGAESRSDASGAFSMPGTDERVMARAPGYRAATVSVADMAGAGGVVKLRAFTPKGVYLTVYGIGSKKLKGGVMALVAKGSINALVIDLKGDNGLVPYPSAAAAYADPSARKLTTIRDLPAFAAEMHKSGVYLIGRIVTFKDTPLATAHPNLAIKRAGGQIFRDREGLAWTDPFRSEVQDYNINLAIEAAKAGFDEVQFDYLRFPDSSARLLLAKASTRASRTQAIATFVAAARRRLRPYNVNLSADIFGYVCWNRDDTGIGQELDKLMPSVDYLSPMLYASGFQFGIPGIRSPVSNSYSIVRQSLAEAQARLKVSPKRFRPWLQAFRDYAFDRRQFDADEVAEQIRAANDFGSDGWMLWNARNVYSDTGLPGAGATPAATGPRAFTDTSPSSSSCA